MRFVLPAALLIAVPALAACTQNATTDNDAAGAGGPISVDLDRPRLRRLDRPGAGRAP